MSYKKHFQILLFLFSLISVSNIVDSKEIAITFDDSPRHASGYFDGPTRSKKLISALKNHNVQQVAFFSVSEKLNAEGIARLNRYAEAGQ